MSFEPNPEPYVDAAAVRVYLGGVSQVTLGHYVRDGLPYKVGRNGRRRYRLSEVDAWFFADQDDARFKRTDSPAGEDVA